MVKENNNYQFRSFVNILLLFKKSGTRKYVDIYTFHSDVNFIRLGKGFVSTSIHLFEHAYIIQTCIALRLSGVYQLQDQGQNKSIKMPRQTCSCINLTVLCEPQTVAPLQSAPEASIKSIHPQIT